MEPGLVEECEEADKKQLFLEINPETWLDSLEMI